MPRHPRRCGSHGWPSPTRCICIPRAAPRRAGRHDPATPRAKRMLSDQGSNILVYLTGHGGNDFLKFQARCWRCC